MEKKIIIIPPCFTYGDILSIISMVYFLTEYYDKVYLCIIYESINYKIINYYKFFFENCEKYNKSIFLIENNQIYEILNNCKFGEYHICNTHTACWSKPNLMFSDIKSIDEKFIGTLGVDYSKRKTKLDMESINHLQVHATALGGVLMTHLSK